MDAETMSDAQTAKRARHGGGRAYHSRLEPHVAFIREQRQRRRTWQEIAALLRAEKGCTVTLQGVHQFYRRYLKRFARPHWEREATASLPAQPTTEPTRRTPLASIPATRPFKTADPDRLKLNDPTQV
jgi:hypothetical protein